MLINTEPLTVFSKEQLNSILHNIIKAKESHPRSEKIQKIASIFLQEICDSILKNIDAVNLQLDTLQEQLLISTKPHEIIENDSTQHLLVQIDKLEEQFDLLILLEENDISSEITKKTTDFDNKVQLLYKHTKFFGLLEQIKTLVPLLKELCATPGLTLEILENEYSDLKNELDSIQDDLNWAKDEIQSQSIPPATWINNLLLSFEEQLQELNLLIYPQRKLPALLATIASYLPQITNFTLELESYDVSQLLDSPENFALLKSIQEISLNLNAANIEDMEMTEENHKTLADFQDHEKSIVSFFESSIKSDLQVLTTNKSYRFLDKTEYFLKLYEKYALYFSVMPETLLTLFSDAVKNFSTNIDRSIILDYIYNLPIIQKMSILQALIEFEVGGSDHSGWGALFFPKSPKEANLLKELTVIYEQGLIQKDYIEYDINIQYANLESVLTKIEFLFWKMDSDATETEKHDIISSLKEVIEEADSLITTINHLLKTIYSKEIVSNQLLSAFNEGFFKAIDIIFPFSTNELHVLFAQMDALIPEVEELDWRIHLPENKELYDKFYALSAKTKVVVADIYSLCEKTARLNITASENPVNDTIDVVNNYVYRFEHILPLSDPLYQALADVVRDLKTGKFTIIDFYNSNECKLLLNQISYRTEKLEAQDNSGYSLDSQDYEFLEKKDFLFAEISNIMEQLQNELQNFLTESHMYVVKNFNEKKSRNINTRLIMTCFASYLGNEPFSSAKQTFVQNSLKTLTLMGSHLGIKIMPTFISAEQDALIATCLSAIFSSSLMNDSEKTEWVFFLISHNLLHNCHADLLIPQLANMEPTVIKTHMPEWHNPTHVHTNDSCLFMAKLLQQQHTKSAFHWHKPEEKIIDSPKLTQNSSNEEVVVNKKYFS